MKKNEKPIAAFFDFDQTLLEVESAKVGIKHLIRRGMVPPDYIVKVMAANLLYKRHLLDDEKMSALLISYYRGRSPERYHAESPEFYHKHLKPRLAPNVMKRVEYHRNAGHKLGLVSAAIRYLLTPAFEDLGFDYLLCTDLETDSEGRYTGRAEGPVCVGIHKQIAVENLAVQENLDLSKSFAYGNHQSDIPMLESVGYPIAVGPTKPLMKHARSNGWPVLSYGR